MSILQLSAPLSSASIDRTTALQQSTQALNLTLLWNVLADGSVSLKGLLSLLEKKLNSVLIPIQNHE